MRYRLRIAADVWLQAAGIDSWWRHRPASPNLFREEVAAALERLEAARWLRGGTSAKMSRQVCDGSSFPALDIRLLRGYRQRRFGSRHLARVEGQRAALLMDQ